ncbi:hypothetical protein UC35_10490 [Ramlibacter tataouinensis]|uniref:Uncharacterized protein n=1 Tax=Ramlibacter tataouinensis TaxID=94132 RepID=A0A127JTM2_9BURK|nr:hypothetical protein UC35_10490 [Ramlibacter tataouinensis]
MLMPQTFTTSCSLDLRSGQFVQVREDERLDGNARSFYRKAIVSKTLGRTVRLQKRIYWLEFILVNTDSQPLQTMFTTQIAMKNES